jgi:phosphate acetyltransferase
VAAQSIEHTLFALASGRTAKSDGKSPPIILLTEGEDIRMQEAARMIVSKGFARPSIVLKERSVVNEIPGVEIIVPSEHPIKAQLNDSYAQIRKGKGESVEEIQRLMCDPLYFSAMLLRAGKADGAVSGAMHTTADVFRAGIRCLGTAPGVKTASSFFLMILKDGRAVTYADCGLIPYPNPEELADITISASANHKKLTGEEPRVAMLSFSTKGSASHERVDHVLKAMDIVKSRVPDLVIDGELQFDAAFVPGVAARKNPTGSIRGDANVFIFPNLDAGNIAYKITERIGEAKAIGPLLQGLALPWMDLSRGCSAEDIMLVAAVAANMS